MAGLREGSSTEHQGKRPGEMAVWDIIKNHCRPMGDATGPGREPRKSRISIHVSGGRMQEKNKQVRGSLNHRHPLLLVVLPTLPTDTEKEQWERTIADAEDEGWQTFYMDGCRIDDLTSAGTYNKGHSTSLYLGKQSTVNDGKLISIGEALEHQEGELLIVTDSKVAITKLQKIARGDPTHEGAAELVRGKWEERVRRSDLDVGVMWVKSHKGVKGNTEADRAAKIGTHLQYQDEITPNTTGTKSLSIGRPTGVQGAKKIETLNRQSRQPGMLMVWEGGGNHRARAQQVQGVEKAMAGRNERPDQATQEQGQGPPGGHSGLGEYLKDSRKERLKSGAAEEGFELDPKKAETLVFRRKGPDYHMLGLTVDWEMKFNAHHQARLALGKAAWGVASRLRPLHPEKRRQIYTSIARPIATWGSWAWYDYGRGNQKEKKLRDLEKWQYGVARGLTGALGTFAEFVAARVEARALRFQDERIRHEDPEAVYLRRLHEPSEPVDIGNGKLTPDRRRKGGVDGTDKLSDRGRLEGIYMDGSRLKERAGAGNDTELLAISEVMREDGEILILTDSRVAITNGHEGIPGKEEADMAAKVGTALQYESEVVTEPGIIQRARRERAAESGRLGLGYRPLQRLGHEVSKIAGLLGKKRLKAWRHRVGKAADADCRWCGEGEESFEHVMERCRVWRRRRPGGEEEIRRPKKSGDGDPQKKVIDLLREPE
ncbi:hypothetical protein BDZ91DRAFT_798534 [Kalaharituber pfeilii]|nr:hypothetical protein BDZ91DRAFT_798534 [Kalaharituber pfeilii]